MQSTLAGTLSRGLRDLAQRVRHAPALRDLSAVWNFLRKPYGKVLRVLGARGGIPIIVGGYRLRLDPAFANLQWDRIEADAYRAFAKSISPGSVVYDVGAHIGTYTIIAAQNAGTRGRVVAYEPNACARQYLIKHLLWNNGMGQTTVRAVCCGAETGTTEFFYKASQAEGNSGLIPVEGFTRGVTPLSTLNDEVASLGVVPNVIKIDVEGTEWDVLKGAEDILARYRPVLFLSLHPRALAARKESPEEVLDWLRQRGYADEVIAVDHEVHVLARPGNLDSR